MFSTFGDDDKFTFVYSHIPIAQAHDETAFDDIKKLVLEFVVVPMKFALKLNETYVGVVDSANKFWTPVFAKGC